MDQSLFHSAKSPTNHNKITSNGFTLVEISIVMIIIGLLIGGIFSGMQLLETANIQKTISDMKSFDSAALTFKDTYRTLPGDLRNPNVRLRNCADTPCAVSGNGDRILGTTMVVDTTETQTVTSEKFVFWHHLSAADLINQVPNVNDMEWGAGQIAAPIGGGYRIAGFVQNMVLGGTGQLVSGHYLRVSNLPSAPRATSATQDIRPFTCKTLEAIDQKMDDGRPRTGRIQSHLTCLQNAGDALSGYGNPNLDTAVDYYLRW